MREVRCGREIASTLLAIGTQYVSFRTMEEFSYAMKIFVQERRYI